ncbi:MAG TPA: TIGR03620 family F420-dependent LLM class oxidoreductase, partial [Candidatus Ruania gallistercoris]|nr:TIGR03620 family F420-dependent LLM class oxidoreductase [Candidatus Ruania gallistercoris]
MTAALGRYGIWARPADATTELAREAERLGYGTLWIGGSPSELADIEHLLDSTDQLMVATGIINMWQVPPDEAAAWFHRLEELHPGRFLLGLGIGHREATAEYRSPYATMTDYLDRLDTDGVPAQQRLLAALGPRVLGLAAERAAGAHPYLVTPEHTATAREVMGAGALLAPEHTVILQSDAAAAREAVRPVVGRYLQMTNYRSNLQRLGFTEADFADGGSDA